VWVKLIYKRQTWCSALFLHCRRRNTLSAWKAVRYDTWQTHLQWRPLISLWCLCCRICPSVCLSVCLSATIRSQCRNDLAWRRNSLSNSRTTWFPMTLNDLESLISCWKHVWMSIQFLGVRKCSIYSSVEVIWGFMYQRIVIVIIVA